MIKYAVFVDGEVIHKRKYVPLNEGLAELQKLSNDYMGVNQ